MMMMMMMMMMIFSNLWRSLAIFIDLWQSLVISGNLRQSSAIFFRQFFTVFGDLRQSLVNFGEGIYNSIEVACEIPLILHQLWGQARAK